VVQREHCVETVLDRLDAMVLSNARSLVCYPNPSSPLCSKIIKELESRGISHVISYGGFKIGGHSILGHGWAGNVFLAVSEKHGLLAVKSLHPKSRRRSMLKEALMWLAASRLHVAPQLFEASRYFIAYKPILGPRLADYRPRTQQEKAYTAARLLTKAHLLDTIGVRHGELSRPHAQVLIDSCSSEPYIIDYDSATLHTKPSNLPKIIGGLARIKAFRDCIDTIQVRPLLSHYKKRHETNILIELKSIILRKCLRPRQLFNQASKQSQ